jgi:hypothetical protein
VVKFALAVRTPVNPDRTPLYWIIPTLFRGKQRCFFYDLRYRRAMGKDGSADSQLSPFYRYTRIDGLGIGGMPKKGPFCGNGATVPELSQGEVGTLDEREEYTRRNGKLR